MRPTIPCLGNSINKLHHIPRLKEYVYDLYLLIVDTSLNHPVFNSLTSSVLFKSFLLFLYIVDKTSLAFLLVESTLILLSFTAVFKSGRHLSLSRSTLLRWTLCIFHDSSSVSNRLSLYIKQSSHSICFPYLKFSDRPSITTSSRDTTDHSILSLEYFYFDRIQSKIHNGRHGASRERAKRTTFSMRLEFMQQELQQKI